MSVQIGSTVLNGNWLVFIVHILSLFSELKMVCNGSGAAWRVQAALEDKAVWDAYFADPSSPQPQLNPLQTYYVGFAGWKNKTDGVKLRFVWPTPGRRSPEAPAFGLHDSFIRNRSEDKVCPTGGGSGGTGLGHRPVGGGGSETGDC